MSNWVWGCVDEKQVKKAMETGLSSMDQATGGAEFVGSEGYIYKTSLSSCSCPAFAIKKGKQPCKHMIRVAVECGILNQKGLTAEEAEKAEWNSRREKAAFAYGMYHLFDRPVMTNEEYDALKNELILHGDIKDGKGCI